MIKRYLNEKISQIFGDVNKTSLWQQIEISVLKIKAHLGIIKLGIYEEIKKILNSHSIDQDWWLKKDQEIHHDLNAFVLERARHLPESLQNYLHDKITSYDTEETPFLIMIHDACGVVEEKYALLDKTIVDFCLNNRYVISIARTHGQQAEMKSLGARGLTWLADLRTAKNQFDIARSLAKVSKFSTAVGNYGSLDPEIEIRVLKEFGFEPYYGSTQILPRVIHAFLAQSLCNLILVIDKIANDIRLNSRSGLPLLQEPFGKKQTGSSAMPHKKNTIRTEQIEGFARMAKGYTDMIVSNIKTWEERSIEQSSVERVAWPDLFHVAVRAIEVIDGVIKNITIYRDNMLQEVIELRGVYASSEVKEFLKERLTSKGLDYEDCYRLVQLACFNVFEVSKERQEIRDYKPTSLQAASILLQNKAKSLTTEIVSIEELIPAGKLRHSQQLMVTPNSVNCFNELLKEVFSDKETLSDWHKIFTPSFLLKNEKVLFKEILGV